MQLIMYCKTVLTTPVLHSQPSPGLARLKGAFWRRFFEILFTMKLITTLILLGTLHVSATSFSQNITVKEKNASLKQVFNEISEQTGYGFLYNPKLVNANAKIESVIKDMPLDQVLTLCLKDQSLVYVIEEKTILISPSSSTNKITISKAIAFIVKGKVTDENGQPMPGATITLKGTKMATRADAKGNFEITVSDDKQILEISFLGYVPQEVPVKAVMNIKLEPKTSNLDEVEVSIGYFSKTKESVTGSQVIVSGEDLRKIGSLNVMQALNAFDPSIRVAPNLDFGSDPNRVPEITIRGENGFDLRSSADDARTNPNAPLYLLDGIEVSATRIYDLDMNRIESFAILRDASATSLYGSRGANGVILITTIAPKVGDVRVSFNANSTVSIPDLRDYNLMNASEKLEYERLGGVFTSKSSNREE